METYEEWHHMWVPACDYVCGRQDLVASVLAQVLNTRVVVIRATPQVGKTTLLRLLGRHILDEQRGLEPVFIDWEFREDRNHLPYEQYLELHASRWRDYNARYLAQNPDSRLIYLIDEAQSSYEEEKSWNWTLKCPNTRRQPLYVLVCVYGAAGISRARQSSIQSQALRIDALQRVELRPSRFGSLHMLFKPEETAVSVKKWAMLNNFGLEDGVHEYLHAATDGHPGMIGLIFKHFETHFSQV